MFYVVSSSIQKTLVLLTMLHSLKIREKKGKLSSIQISIQYECVLQLSFIVVKEMKEVKEKLRFTCTIMSMSTTHSKAFFIKVKY